MGKSIDVSGYRYLPDKNGKNKKASLSKKKKSSGRPFIMRADIEWLVSACKCGASATRVALALTYLVGMKKTDNGLRMGRGVLEMFGINAQMQMRGLDALERKGLITCTKRIRGARPIVCVLRGTADE